MNDRIFSLVNALLHRGYILRVVHAGGFESRLQWEDYEGGTEEIVWDCYRRILSASVRTPEVYIFSSEEWAEEESDASARLEIDRDGDTVSYHREYAPDSFITNRVKETR